MVLVLLKSVHGIPNSSASRIHKENQFPLVANQPVRNPLPVLSLGEWIPTSFVLNQTLIHRGYCRDVFLTDPTQQYLHWQLPLCTLTSMLEVCDALTPYDGSFWRGPCARASHHELIVTTPQQRAIGCNRRSGLGPIRVRNKPRLAGFSAPLEQPVSRRID